MEEHEVTQHTHTVKSRIVKYIQTPFISGMIGGVVGALGVAVVATSIIPSLSIAPIASSPFSLVSPRSTTPKEESVLAPVAPAVSPELSVTEVVKKVNPSVVSIEVRQQVPIFETLVPSQNNFFEQFFFGLPLERRQVGTREQVVGKGTGFFVSRDGYIITNRHVVDQVGDTSYRVTTTEGKTLSAVVVARDAVLDVAVLKVAGAGFPAVTLGDSDVLELGQSVVAIGFALGEFQNSVSTGIISGLSRSITASGGGRTEQLDRVIQTDAAINPGNSGGPLINRRGEVIGVNVATAQGAQSIGFALPINAIKSIITSVRTTGAIVRPYIGVRYVTITEELAQKEELPVSSGIVLRGGSDGAPAVISGSPADRAGLRAGDIVTAVDGVSLQTNSFANLIREKTIGQSVALTVVSNGTTKTVRVVLERAP